MDGLMLDTERVAVMAYDYAGEMAGIGKAGFYHGAHTRFDEGGGASRMEGGVRRRL